MFFGQLFERLSQRTHKKGPRKNAAALFPTPSSDMGISEIASHSVKNIKSKQQLNKALNDINNAIQNNGANNQLLLDKAEILIQKEKYKQASQTLNQISKRNCGLKTSKRASELRSLAKQLHQEASTKKIADYFESLCKIAAKYQQNQDHFPHPKSADSNPDITQFVRQEARQAQANGLPNYSRELIELSLEAGHQSPWLLYEKAVSISMMGRRKEALRILAKLKREAKGEKLSRAIDKKSEALKNNTKQNPLKAKEYLANESKLIIVARGIKIEFPAEQKNIDPKDNIKSLIFKQARTSIASSPDTTHDLCSLILDYFPDDLACLQLKGESLASLKQSDEAIRIWGNLVHSSNKNFSQKASELIADELAAQAAVISAKKSPSAALSFFIKQHIALNLAPILNKEMSKILRKAKRIKADSLDPELQKHQLHLLFNTLVIEHLENHWRGKGRLTDTAAAQNPGSIRKTAPKAG